MSLQPFVPWLLAAFAVSVAGQYFAARAGAPWLSIAAAALVPVAAIAVGYGINRPHWQAVDQVAGTPNLAIVARRNARLMAMTWAAGAAALLAIYPGAGLRWQHGWQYGIGMALIAILSFAYALELARGNSRVGRRAWLDGAAVIVVLQALAALAGLILLVASGKVWSTRPDWAANIVFVAGGIAIVAVSALAVRSHIALRQAR